MALSFLFSDLALGSPNPSDPGGRNDRIENETKPSAVFEPPL
jgi:hypothetical protein